MDNFRLKPNYPASGLNLQREEEEEEETTRFTVFLKRRPASNEILSVE